MYSVLWLKLFFGLKISNPISVNFFPYLITLSSEIKDIRKSQNNTAQLFGKKFNPVTCGQLSKADSIWPVWLQSSSIAWKTNTKFQWYEAPLSTTFLVQRKTWEGTYWSIRSDNGCLKVVFWQTINKKLLTLIKDWTFWNIITTYQNVHYHNAWSFKFKSYMYYPLFTRSLSLFFKLQYIYCSKVSWQPLASQSLILETWPKLPVQKWACCLTGLLRNKFNKWTALPLPPLPPTFHV